MFRHNPYQKKVLLKKEDKIDFFSNPYYNRCYELRKFFIKLTVENKNTKIKNIKLISPFDEILTDGEKASLDKNIVSYENNKICKAKFNLNTFSFSLNNFSFDFYDNGYPSISFPLIKNFSYINTKFDEFLDRIVNENEDKQKIIDVYNRNSFEEEIVRYIIIISENQIVNLENVISFEITTTFFNIDCNGVINTINYYLQEQERTKVNDNDVIDRLRYCFEFSKNYIETDIVKEFNVENFFTHMIMELEN